MTGEDQEAREAGTLDECGHCNAAFDLLEPHMRPDEATNETIARLLSEHVAAHTTLGLARDGDTLTALGRGYTVLVEKTRELEELVGEWTDRVIFLREELSDSEAKEAALQLEVERLEAFGCEALSDEEMAGRYDPTPEAEALIAAKKVADADVKYQASLDAQFGCEDARQELIAAREAYRRRTNGLPQT